MLSIRGAQIRAPQEEEGASFWGLRPQLFLGAGSTGTAQAPVGHLGAPGSHVAGAQCPPSASVPPCGPGRCGWGGSRRISPQPSGLQSVYERQGIAVMTPTVPGSPKGPFLGLPRGTMRRQKSIGKKRGHPTEVALGSQSHPNHPPARPLDGGHPASLPRQGALCVSRRSEMFLPPGHNIQGGFSRLASQAV